LNQRQKKWFSREQRVGTTDALFVIDKLDKSPRTRPSSRNIEELTAHKSKETGVSSKQEIYAQR
jgi:hypothetical protein